MPRIALNGLGRIGKLVLRDLIDTGAGGDIVLLNDPVGDAEQHVLGSGDSLYYSAALDPRWSNASVGRTRFLIVNAPPAC